MDKKKFAMYYGLGGSFGGARFGGIVEAFTEKEAEHYAYMEAVEEYESYGGCHGLTSWEECKCEVAELYHNGEYDAVQDYEVDDYYREEIEGWIIWYVEEIHEGDYLDEDGFIVSTIDECNDYEYNDDDADRYCE